MLNEITELLQPATEEVVIGTKKIIMTEVPIEYDATLFYVPEVGNLNLLVACARDEQGEPVFTQEDVPKLKKMGSVKMRKLLTAALRVNGYWLEDNEKK